MHELNKKITLKDIAELAGVSMTTASVCINGKAKKYKIAESTCQRIEKIIKENNFNPNLHARAIASKKVYLIGVVLPTRINFSFWLDIITGIEEEITPHKYHMILSVSHNDLKKELESIRFMMEKGVDGFILAPTVLGENKHNLKKISRFSKEKPFVSLLHPVEGIPGVFNDETIGGELAAEYLFKKGHRKIASIGSFFTNTRGEYFNNKLKQYGINGTHYSSIEEFVKDCKRYTAVFCFSDYIVMDLYNELLKHSISVPDDLSVVGYDNMEFTKLLNPRPATIHQYKKELGVQAAKMLINNIDNKESSGEKVFYPYLVEGESVKDLNY